MQEATAGKFRLGLGTQVKTHVVRRYSAAFEHPGPRLRDYVLIAFAAPPVGIAAVNPWMLRMAGEVADGVHIHPLGPGSLPPLRRGGATPVGRRIER